MKRWISALLMSCFLLGGCAASVSGQPEMPRQCLTVCIPGEQDFWIPVLREFQQRSGIWIRTCNAPAEPEEGMLPDLVIGFAADSASDGKCVGWQVPVIVSNPYLIRKNPPRRFADLGESQWARSLSFADPAASGFSRCALALLAGADPEGSLRAFSGAVSRVTGDPRSALADVCNGTTALGLVPESEALLAMDRGQRLELIYPEEGSFLLPILAVIPESSPDPADAEALRGFLLEESTQSYLWNTAQIRPADGALLPGNPVFIDEGKPDSQNRLVELWRQLREVEP